MFVHYIDSVMLIYLLEENNFSPTYDKICVYT